MSQKEKIMRWENAQRKVAKKKLLRKKRVSEYPERSKKTREAKDGGKETPKKKSQGASLGFVVILLAVLGLSYVFYNCYLDDIKSEKRFYDTGGTADGRHPSFARLEAYNRYVGKKKNK